MDTSNSLRNDMNHANEFVRGLTCRFLCKIREKELIEPVLSSLRECLVRIVVL